MVVDSGSTNSITLVLPVTNTLVSVAMATSCLANSEYAYAKPSNRLENSRTDDEHKQHCEENVCRIGIDVPHMHPSNDARQPA
jgi:hypothetical protein